jgi:hypothetical protein
LDYKFWLALFSSLGIGGYNIVLQRRQIALMSKAKPKKGAATEPPSFWGSYGRYFVMLGFIGLAWAPYAIDLIWSPPHLTEFSYMTIWGPNSPPGQQPTIGGLKTLLAVANGRTLTSYSANYKLAAIAFHYYGMSDVDDVSTLQKSNLYDIKDQEAINILIPVTDVFREEMAHAGWGTNYGLLLVPNGVSMDQFSTIRQAKALGVKVMQTSSGPP